MLKQEDAEKALKAFHSESFDKQCLKALRGAPQRVREIGEALICGWNCDTDGVKVRTTYEEWCKTTAQTAELSDDDRLSLFRILFPKLVPYVEAGWQLHRRLPYVIGHVSKPFRAPREADVAKEAGAVWVRGLHAYLSGYDQDIRWIATWAAYIHPYSVSMPISALLAAAIDAGGAEGDEVFDILAASARGEHHSGGSGHHAAKRVHLSLIVYRIYDSCPRWRQCSIP